MRDERIHVGIIMDGNGRWARRRGMPRPAGHAAGARAVRSVVESAAETGAIECLTLYAFSSDNWLRPADEVDALMRLFDEYLERETPRCVENGIRLQVVGRRDRLSASLVERIEAAEAATADGGRMRLRLAVDYSARDMIVRAAELAAAWEGGRRSRSDPLTSSRTGTRAEPALDRDRFRQLLGQAMGSDAATRDVDLLIRTGGEQRLSDFMLWECAYAELYFTPVLWPDFGPAELEAAVAEFDRRERRFGRVLKEAV